MTDAADRRAKVIAFTKKGRRADAVGVVAVADQEEAWARLCGVEPMRGFRAVLERLTAAHGLDVAERQLLWRACRSVHAESLTCG